MLLPCILALAWIQCKFAFPPPAKPNIYLADNLDEPDQYGYCLDIRGWGASLNCGSTQAHSCKSSFKSQGDDTQFRFDASSKSIQAVNYDGACSAGTGGCLSVVGTVAAGSKFEVKVCDGSAKQKFAYESDRTFTMEEGSLCMVVDASSRVAGNYKARDLSLQSCTTDGTLKTWVVVDASGNVVGGSGQATTVAPTTSQTTARPGSSNTTVESGSQGATTGSTASAGVAKTLPAHVLIVTFIIACGWLQSE